ncbi:MAG: deoxyguanosinetriphosphate triphosphohydrolase, partial [Candidatus Acidiferrales bacterium]
FEARLLELDAICSGVPAFTDALREVERSHPQGRTKLKFNEALKRVLDRLATDLIDHTRAAIRRSGVESVADVRAQPQRLARFSDEVAQQNATLKRFLYAELYDREAIVEERDRSVGALEELFRFYLERPEQMPKFYAEQAKSEPRHRVACDYIAGMTDHFLLRQHAELLGAAQPLPTARRSS